MNVKQIEKSPVKNGGEIRNYGLLSESIIKGDGAGLKVMAATSVKEALRLLKEVKDEKVLGFVAINAKPKVAMEAAAKVADESVLHKIALKGGEGVACFAANRITNVRKLDEISKRRKDVAGAAASRKIEEFDKRMKIAQRKLADEPIEKDRRIAEWIVSLPKEKASSEYSKASPGVRREVDNIGMEIDNELERAGFQGC